jgi:hypothetical protein
MTEVVHPGVARLDPQEAKHTPGRWDFYRDEDYNVISIQKYVVGDNGGSVSKTICRMTTPNIKPVHANTGIDWSEINANATLIAAAPDMYDSLRALVWIIEAAGLLNLSNGVQLGPTSWFVKASDRLDAARTALAKALGDGASTASTKANSGTPK